jgi:hypothetical protein
MVDVQEVADNARLTVHLGTTAEGKELWLSRTPGQPLRKICFKGGGKLPEILEGGFSTIQVAKTAVEAYIVAKAEAGKKVKKGRGAK